MHAAQARLLHITREQRQQWRVTTLCFCVSRRKCREPKHGQPTVMRCLRREPIRAEERMREPPGVPFDLAERLRHPAREFQVVELFEHRGIFLPELVEW